jgi:small subunit ribosomal protein S11
VEKFMASGKNPSKTATVESKKKVASRTARKKVRKVPNGVVHVQASFNNTLITVADPQGKVLAQASAGSEGFKGSRKSTPFAAQVAAEKVGKASKELFGMVSIIVRVKGPGPGRESVIKTFIALGFKIILIQDVTGIPHNGPRPPKKRRI